MNKSIATILVAGLVLSVGAHELLAQDKAKVDELDKKADSINATAKNPGKMKAAFQSISSETGVPVDQVEHLHKNHPDAGPAGIMLACSMADETKKSAGHFLDSRLSGKGWGAIAHDNKVSVDKLNERLDHMATYLASAPEKAENPKNTKEKK